MATRTLSSLRRHPWRWSIGAAIVLSAVWIANAVFGEDPPAQSWLTAPVRRGDIEDVVLATATLRANKLINVGAQTSGQIKALHVRLGERVRVGQLIAEIDPTLQQSTVRDEIAALDVMRAQRSSRVASLRQAESALQRQRTMFAEDATSRQELQAAEAQYASAKGDLMVLDAQLHQSDIKLQTARTNLSYTRIVAPIDGVVVAVVTEAGQTLNSVQSAPTVVKLASLDPMQVEAQISEADVPRVTPGMPAYFTLLGDPDRRYETRLDSIDPGPSDIGKDQAGGNGSPSAIYYNAQLRVANPEGALRIAMTAQVRIITRRARNVVIVPSAALGERGADGRYPVRVVRKTDDGAQTVSTRQVRIGMNNRVDAAVVAGLNVGEEVVVAEDTTDSMSGVIVQ